ncbi:hypothetical protein Goshw_007197 [Gossypium schwendimanii]|uniref:Uncharacterized protein n=1 Tax=Gossypium schwendimanii TaxID=34291 RepID=A0A7J9KQK4_GOSSC|nr:hypothetical protein [Gossypium schwendimanii]
MAAACGVHAQCMKRSNRSLRRRLGPMRGFSGHWSLGFCRRVDSDYNGKVVPKKRFDDVVKKNGVGLTFACMAMSSSIDGPADETNLTATGEIRLMPDLLTMRKIPWKKQEEMVLADMHLRPGQPWEYCRREALRRVSKVLKYEFNLEMNTGFENEFYLLKKIIRKEMEECWVPIDLKPYCSSSGFDAVSTLFV